MTTAQHDGGRVACDGRATQPLQEVTSCTDVHAVSRPSPRPPWPPSPRRRAIAAIERRQGPQHHEEPVRAPRRQRRLHQVPPHHRRSAGRQRLQDTSASPTASAPQRDGDDIIVYNNHELGNTAGAVRRHGQKGAFVSQLRIDRRTLKVEPDATSSTRVSSTGTTSARAGAASRRPPAARTRATPLDTSRRRSPPFDRFCSSSLTEAGPALQPPHAAAATPARSTSPTRRAATRPALRRDRGRRRQAAAAPGPVLLGEHARRRHPQRPDARPRPGGRAGEREPGLGYLGKKTKSGDAFKRAGLTNGTSFVHRRE